MKGISPMIATVLLVAFTVAVGGILMLWFTSVTRTTTSAASTQIEANTKCAGIFSIPSVNSADNKVYVAVGGSGLKVYPLFATVGSTVVTLTSGPISSGTYGSITVTIGGNTSVKITGACEYGGANVTVEASCTKPESCWS